MTFIVETGSGMPEASSYVTEAFALAYLTDRGRETENSWSTLASAVAQEHLMVATSYIDIRWGSRILGTKLRTDLVGQASEGRLTLGANPLNTETVTLGQETYRFVTTLAQAMDVLIGTTADGSLDNLIAATQLNGVAGTTYHSLTRPTYEVTLIKDTDTVADDVIVQAQQVGPNGDTIALSTTVTGASVSGATLTGGRSGGEQRLEFPRLNAWSRNGAAIRGVPDGIMRATVEYAVRNASGTALLVDPTHSATNEKIDRERVKVGPIEEEIRYRQGSSSTFRTYPEADALVWPFLRAAGGSYR